MHGTERDLDYITGEIVDASFKLHVGLGPGLLESVYEAVLARDLERRGLRAARQKLVSFEYVRVDLLVESAVVVEIKSVEHVLPVFKKQVLTCLRLMNLSVGLLINFGAPTLKEGVQRIVNRYRPSAPPLLCVTHSEMPKPED